MALSTDSTVITQTIKDMLEGNKASLGLKNVYYGQQPIIPEYPAAVVESFPKSRELAGTRRYEVTLRVGVLVYHAKIGDTEGTKKAAEVQAERVEDLLHQDYTLGGLVIHGFVVRIDPGVAIREGAMIRASRLMWEGFSKEMF